MLWANKRREVVWKPWHSARPSACKTGVLGRGSTIPHILPNQTRAGVGSSFTVNLDGIARENARKVRGRTRFTGMGQQQGGDIYGNSLNSVNSKK